MPKPSDAGKQRKPLSRMRSSILLGMKFFLVVIDWNAGVSGLHEDFSSKGCSMQLNILFLNRGVRGMLGWKDYLAVDILFLIIGVYIDCATVFQNDANMAGVHSVYSEVVSKVVSQNHARGWSVAKLEKLRRVRRAFKQKVVSLFWLSVHPDYLR